MKIHEKSLTCLAVIFTLILVTSAGAYLVYRAWDYWSADQTYADIGRNAVQKVKVKGSPNRDNEALTSKKSTPGRDGYGQNDGTAESYDADKSRHDSTDESSEPEIIDGITIPDKPAIDWDELTKSGKDIVAWLDIPVLGIAYPVVQGDDNEFYLHHLPNGEYKNAGSLFMEAANSPDLTDINTVIYGHNMDNGSMFGKFRNLTGDDYEKQPFLWLCTREKTGLYKMISLHISRVDDESYTLFEPDEAAAGEGLLEHADRTVFEWIHSENRRSYINMTIPRSAFSRVVTFSTCASYSDERRVLQAILVREYDRRTDT
jgi:sortase B